MGGERALGPWPMVTESRGEVRTPEGIALRWRSVGEGPALVCCNGVGVGTFFWKYVEAGFADRMRVLTWDYRGHGQSDPLPDPWTGDIRVERHAEDMRLVLDDAGIDRAMVLGHSMGCQVLLEFYRRFPERVAGVVTILGTAGHCLDTFYDYPGSPRYFRLAERVIKRLDTGVHAALRPLLLSPLAWTVARRGRMVDPLYAAREDMLPYMEHLARIDFRMFIRAILAAQDHDGWDVLPTITVPSLVVAAEKDAFTPMWLSRKMASSIPGGELLVLADGSHAAIIEQPETINHRLERFIRERGVFSLPG